MKVKSESDSVKRDLPFLKANRCGGIADISSGRRVFGGVPVARNNCIRPVAHYFVWKLGFPLGEFGDLLKMNWDQFRGGWNKLGQLRCLNWFLMSFRSWDLMGWSINQVYFKLHRNVIHLWRILGGWPHLDLKCYNRFYGGLRCRIRGQLWQRWGWQRRRGGQSESKIYEQFYTHCIIL